jgi:hypothetical protein
MKYLSKLGLLFSIVTHSVLAQPKVKQCSININGDFVNINIPKKYKGNFYSGIPQVVGDSIKFILPNAIDRVIIEKDTLFSWPRFFPANSSFNQLFKRIYSGKRINVLLTVLDEYGGFYLIKKSTESQFRLLINIPRMIDPKGEINNTSAINNTPATINPFPTINPISSSHRVATLLKKYKGLDVLSFHSEGEYIKFLVDYFKDCSLLSNKFKNSFYTSNDLILAFEEYDRCK